MLGFWGATAWLGIITVGISWLSDTIVDTIQGAAEESGVPYNFISTILLPIVGNAAEHAAAVIFTWKNKPDLALGIAVGSASQIAMFVIPMCVVIGWWICQELSLDFHPFETAALLMTVLVTSILLNSGESDWMRGAMLLAAYTILGIGFWVHEDVQLPTMSPTSLNTSSPT